MAPFLILSALSLHRCSFLLPLGPSSACAVLPDPPDHFFRTHSFCASYARFRSTCTPFFSFLCQFRCISPSVQAVLGIFVLIHIYIHVNHLSCLHLQLPLIQLPPLVPPLPNDTCQLFQIPLLSSFTSQPPIFPSTNRKPIPRQPPFQLITNGTHSPHALVPPAYHSCTKHHSTETSTQIPQKRKKRVTPIKPILHIPTEPPT